MGCGAVTNVKLPFIHQFRDRHGKLRFYYRRPRFKRVALPGLPGSAEFMAAYEAACADGPLETGANKTADGTLNKLIVTYYKSAEFSQLRDTTKKTYRGILERLRVAHGDKRVASIQREHVRALVAQKAATPAAANSLLKILRVLMKLAVDERLRSDDPTIGVRRLRESGAGFHAWDESEIAKFEARWKIGTRQRLAFGLMLHLGQSRGDVFRLGRQHLRGNQIVFTQRKTGTRLALPVHPQLRVLLDALPPEQLTFIMTEEGKPFTDAGAGGWFRAACDAAGLPQCSAHGLRKASARRLAEAGASANEIASVTGHRSLAEVSRYTASAEQAKLATAAMARIRENGSESAEAGSK